jgi:hypothetical protein
MPVSFLCSLEKDCTRSPLVPSVSILARVPMPCWMPRGRLFNAYSTICVGLWFLNRWMGDRQALIISGTKQIPVRSVEQTGMWSERKPLLESHSQVHCPT